MHRGFILTALLLLHLVLIIVFIHTLNFYLNSIDRPYPSYFSLSNAI